MAELVVPQYDPQETWPTLGPQVADWIETFLVFGPGDLLGEPATLDADTRGLIYSLYEVYPPYSPIAGRRRFRRAGISLRKGTAKTEKAAWIAAAELHPEAPVRCDGFDAHGQPVGVGITDPYIPMVAVTEDQSEELAYGALKEILERSEIGEEFDIGLERIIRLNGRGKCEAVAGQPDSRDGARTTFQLFDESHRLRGRKLTTAHQVMLQNIVKRKDSNGWTLEITTAPQPGEGSVAEATWNYAEEIAHGKRKDSDLFFFHRQASDGYQLELDRELTNEEDVRKAVIEASGDAIAAWSDIDGIVGLWRDPQTDRSYFERVWLNRKVQASAQVFDMQRIYELQDQRLKRLPNRKTPIAIGFDGSRVNDSTGIIGTEIETGYQFQIAVWERPAEGTDDADEWEVPVHEVEEAIEFSFDHWKVVKAYFDPYYWDQQVDAWYGKWPKRVIKFYTSQHRKMAFTIQSYLNAWRTGEAHHDGSAEFLRHMANARKSKLKIEDDQGESLFIMTKESRYSVLKIDLAMAGTLSWAARLDAISDGALRKVGSRPGRTTVYTG